LGVKEVDALIARLFNVCKINTRAYWGSLNPEAQRFLQHENSECAAWF
jgi:hypothetical protein